MNKRQVVILWVIALALGAAVAAVKIGRQESVASATERTPGQTLFAEFPDTEVAAIELESATDRTLLNKAEDGWVVVNRDGYPAETPRINEFIRTLAELQVTQGIEAGPSFAPRFGMDPDASDPEQHGIAATFKNASGEVLAQVSFGKNIEGASSSPFGGGTAGRFVRNHDDESGFYAVNEMFPSLTAEPQRWLQEGFITVEKIQTVSVTEPGSDEIAWKVVREDENAEFALSSSVGEQAAETSATTPLKNLFSYARFDDLIPSDEVDERVETEQQRTAVIETFEGFTYTIRFAPMKPEEQAEPSEDEEAPPPAEDKYYVTVEVDANLPAERKKPEGETEEDAKSKDAAFTERHKTLTERLAKERKLAGHAFVVSQFTVEPLLKSRADLAGSSSDAAPANQTSAATGPIEAVTPPIAIPPLEENESLEEETVIPAED